MRTYDLTPFYRSTVGFDRFFSLLDQATADGSPGYPPYNIERTGDNSYRISVAVSGFSQAELSIVAKENTLTIKGEKSANENGKDKSEVLYRGIAARAFERAFQLADFVLVKNASLENGLLHVDLVREIPEAKKPRSIPITTTNAVSSAGRRRLGREGRRLSGSVRVRRYAMRKRPGKPGRFLLSPESRIHIAVMSVTLPASPSKLLEAKLRTNEVDSFDEDSTVRHGVRRHHTHGRLQPVGGRRCSNHRACRRRTMSSWCIGPWADGSSWAEVIPLSSGQLA